MQKLWDIFFLTPGFLDEEGSAGDKEVSKIDGFLQRTEGQTLEKLCPLR